VKTYRHVNAWARSLALLALVFSLGQSACSGAFEHASAEAISVDESRPKISDKDAKKLQSDFTKAQFQEQKQLRDRHAQELKDFIKQQKRDLDAYKTDSTKRVKDFIGDHRGHGEEIRAFVRDDRAKYDVYRKGQVEALRKKRDDQKNERNALHAAQENNQLVFKAYLDKGFTPPETLWPGHSPAAK
jgi:hypothetical protein